MVAAVAHEEPLAGVIHSHAARTGNMVCREPDRLGIHVRLPEYRDDRGTGLDPVGMDIEHHDLAADAWKTGAGATVNDEQALVHMVYGHRAGKFHLGFGMVTGGRAPRECAGFAKDVIGGGMGQGAVVIEFENFNATITISGNKKPVMDAVQRPLRWSPYTVATRSPVGYASDERGIAPQVFLAKQVACRLTVSLGQHCGRQYETHDNTQHQFSCIHDGSPFSVE